jgi:hypothetical protein
MTPPSNTERTSPDPPSTLTLELRVFLAALFFRAASGVVRFLASATFPEAADQGFSVFDRPSPLWDSFARSDAGWYYGIAARGYDYVEGGRNNLAFFPLYPILMGGLGHLFGGRQPDFYIAGIVVSWAAFALAAVVLYRLARLDLEHRSAIRVVAYASALPGAQFFGVVYSESLFFLTLVSAVLALRERRWVMAGVSAAAMTATRVTGVMFLPALALLAWQSAGEGSQQRRRAAGAVAAGLLGIGAYSGYNYWIAGDPFEWFHAIQRWEYRPGGNPLAGMAAVGEAILTRPIQYLSTERMAPYDAVNTLSAAFALALVPLVWLRYGLAYAAVIPLGLYLPLSSGSLEGLSRYSAVLFPVAIGLGGLKGELRHLLLMVSLTLIYGLCLAWFATAHPFL